MFLCVSISGQSSHIPFQPAGLTRTEKEHQREREINRPLGVSLFLSLSVITLLPLRLGCKGRDDHSDELNSGGDAAIGVQREDENESNDSKEVCRQATTKSIWRFLEFSSGRQLFLYRTLHLSRYFRVHCMYRLTTLLLSACYVDSLVLYVGRPSRSKAHDCAVTSLCAIR